MSLDDLTAQSGGWQSHPDNPVGERSSSSSASGVRSRSFRKGDPCPICDQADKRCSVSDQGVYRCWNFRAEGDRPDFAWSFRKVATSSYGGEWGCWTKASHCDRCGTKDSRCWKNDQGIFYCANSLQGLGEAGNPPSGHPNGASCRALPAGRWQFLGQSNGKKGQLWGKWQSTHFPQKLPTVKQITKRIISPDPVDEQPPSPPTNSEPDQLLEPQVQGFWRPIHRWLWEQASPTLQGRFVGKLADVHIGDTSYSRYLSPEAIQTIEQTVHEYFLSGQWSTEEILASGWFYFNRGFDSPHPYRCALLPGRLIAYYDTDGALDLVRGNPEVPKIKQKKLANGKSQQQRAKSANHKAKKQNQKPQTIKYQQAKGIPTRPYFPRASRDKLAECLNANTKYFLIATEGEDKAEAAAQNCSAFGDDIPIIWVSVPGVWNFKGADEEDLHPDLVKTLTLARQVVIAYDSDIQYKKEVAQAMKRLASRVIEHSEGRLIPLAADWIGLLSEHPELRTTPQTQGANSPSAPSVRRWGLDDLWGHLIREGKNALTYFERLLSPNHARMVKRWWQRKGKAWKVEDEPPLLTLAEGRTQTHKAIADWFEAGLSTLSSAYHDRVALAATCGLGKTYSLGHVLTDRMNIWWSGAGSTEAIELWDELDRLEQKKATTLPDSPERWGVLKEIHEVKNQLAVLYQQDLGGPLVVVFRDHEALSKALSNYVFPATGYRLPPWLAIRTGREAPEQGIPIREQITPGSLACAHHEAVGELGEQRHSPSAAACQHCIWGQTGQCGFLDSLRVAHRVPVVYATIQALLNASHELEEFTQIVCDEALDTHLVETLEIAKAVRLILNSLQRGLAGEWYTLPPMYTTDEIQALITVFSEMVAALSRYGTATDTELEQRGHHLAHWCDAERLKPYLLLLKDLKPLRWNYDKNEVEPASYFPWERPRYKLGESGVPLHQETYGEDQQFAFEHIPLRATTEIISDLYQAIVEGKPGAYLSLERQLTQEVAATENGDELITRRQVKLHMTRPHHHLIKALRTARVLNLDATPNEAVLERFLPDMRIQKIQAEWVNTEMIQILSGPMGRATPSNIDQVLPLVKALGGEHSVLLFSHKKHTQQVDEAQALAFTPGLLTANDAAGDAHSMAWYGYQDRAVDDPTWKQADYLILVGAHRTNIGHSSRLAAMLKRFSATDKQQIAKPKNTEASLPYRVESYGPQGYELVVENEDPLLDALIEHERIASLEQACQRPRPVSRDKPLKIILMRSDPMPAPYNRYVRVVSSIEELMGVTHRMKNQANYARHAEALIRHSEAIEEYFVRYHSIPGSRQLEAFGKVLYGIGGSRANGGAMKHALALFAAQLLPSLQANENIVQSRAQFLEDLVEAAGEHFDINVCPAELSLSPAAREVYWAERYRQGNTHTRLITWMCTRHQGASLKEQLEAIQPIHQVLQSLRNDIARRLKTAGDESGP